LQGIEEEDRDVNRFWMTLRKDKGLEFERGRATLHSSEKSLWKRL
jgi:hypothetical protein